MSEANTEAQVNSISKEVHAASEMLSQIVSEISRRDGVAVKTHSGSTVFDPAKKTLWIDGALMQEFAVQYSNTTPSQFVEKISPLLSRVAHESGKALWTGISTNDAVNSIMDSLGIDKNDPQRDSLAGFTGRLFNSLDSERIQRLLSTRYAGLPRHFCRAAKKFENDGGWKETDVLTQLDRYVNLGIPGELSDSQFDDWVVNTANSARGNETVDDVREQTANIVRDILDNQPPQSGGGGGENENENEDGDGESGSGQSGNKGDNESTPKSPSQASGVQSSSDSDENSDSDSDDNQESSDASAGNSGKESDESDEQSESGSGESDGGSESDENSESSGKNESDNGEDNLDSDGDSDSNSQPPSMNDVEQSAQSSGGDMFKDGDKNGEQRTGSAKTSLYDNGAKASCTASLPKKSVSSPVALGNNVKPCPTRRKMLDSIASGMVSRFVQFRNAVAHQKTMQYKTGKLNTNALAMHSVRDDIFLNDVMEAKQQSHGIVVVLDNSVSMRGSKWRAALDNMYLLIRFAESLSIPIEIFSLVGVGCDRSHQQPGGDIMLAANGGYLPLVYSSSSMSGVQKEAVIKNALSERGGGLTPQGSTPLSETLSLMDAPIAAMKNSGIDIVNLMVITDGGDNGAVARMVSPGAVVVTDNVTKTTYTSLSSVLPFHHYFTVLNKRYGTNSVWVSIEDQFHGMKSVETKKYVRAKGFIPGVAVGMTVGSYVPISPDDISAGGQHALRAAQKLEVSRTVSDIGKNQKKLFESAKDLKSIADAMVRSIAARIFVD